ncbi:right-handed parallel beta-helix repeat-containing protein [Geojedonia litorea]|uniref:Right-handed parallel beta-helix repeat-containing protein n=1 Tax=Geojedonia litorea TaxID=1268269 RepID=A0ABV9N1J5_9FLAO
MKLQFAMKKFAYFILTLMILVFWSSCRTDFEFSPSSGNLGFSKDTVYLDTVFSNIGSSTYNLKVYNKSNTDIVIPTVRLTQGQASNYRLNVDGIPGKEFENVELLAKDSMYIFIETTIDIQALATSSTQFLYTDAIEFDSGANLQKVELVTLVKDAVFIYPNKDSVGIIETLSFDIDNDGQADDTNIQGRFLTDSELTFTNEKPYVIYGYAAVDEGKTLTVQAGARVHFHANSGLLITNTASLIVNGALSNNQEELENEVIFEGDRLEPIFEDVPGQWGTIWLFNGSGNNQINYATIKNATVGILSDGNQNGPNNKLTISNSKIYNSSNFGILGRGTSILAENVVINKAGQSSFAGTYGGKYNFTHCTIANYWSSSFRQFPSLFLNNYVTDENNAVFTNDLTEANFNNCIIYGNDNPELLLDEENGSAFNFKFTNCLIRFEDNSNHFTGPNYNFNDALLYENVIFNQNPDFKEPFENELIIGADSAANNKGNTVFANQVPFDILNVNRSAAPDLGAYQHIIFED